jgi:hypothetical protein
MDNLQQPLPLALLRKNLETQATLSDIERLIFQAFAKQQGYTQFTPEQSLMTAFLADDVFEIWQAYLSRNNPLAFVQETHARAQELMRRHYCPRADRR